MSEQKVGIMAECICDLPKKYLRDHNIGVLYFLVKTDRGVFTDTDEVTADNIIGYMETNSVMPVSSPPPIETYVSLFRRMLEEYDEAILITTGSGASESYEAAVEAVSSMGESGSRICIFDSKHLSTGLGHIIIKASEMAEAGASKEEIISALNEFRNRVSTSFITVNADYLYRNGRVSIVVKRMCDILGIHPILMMKNGGLVLKSIRFGNYERASLRYVRSELKKAKNIDKTRIFVTHVGCSMKEIDRIKMEISRMCKVDKLIVTRASATISSNCGPGTFGMLFVNEGD